MELYQEGLRLLGFGLCHQIPDRSFIYNGVQSSVCARCLGIYIGILVTLVTLFLLYRGAQRIGIPGIPYFIGATIGVLAMGVDGLASYLGFYETTNLARMTTGIMFGSAMAPIIYLLLVESLARNKVEGRILGSARDVLFWILGIPFGLLIAYGISPLLGIGAPGMQGAFIFVTFWLIATVLVGLVPRFMHSVGTWRDMVWPMMWALPMACAIILLCAGLQFWAMGVLG
jgi:uncharacterized membrane protein